MELLNLKKLNNKINQEEIVIVSYFATWCKPCQKVASILNILSIIRQNKIKVIKIDVDFSGDLAMANNINLIPTLQYYKKGVLFLTESGAKQSDHIQKNIETLLVIN